MKHKKPEAKQIWDWVEIWSWIDQEHPELSKFEENFVDWLFCNTDNLHNGSAIYLFDLCEFEDEEEYNNDTKPYYDKVREIVGEDGLIHFWW